MNLENSQSTTQSSSNGSLGINQPSTSSSQQQQQQQSSQSQQQSQSQSQNHRSEQEHLNAYIYDYLLKHNMQQSAHIFSQEADIKMHTVLKGLAIPQTKVNQQRQNNQDSSSDQEIKSEKDRANGDSNSSNAAGKSSNNDTDLKSSSNTQNSSNNSDESNSVNNSNNLNKSTGIIDAPEGFLFEWWLIFWDLLFARSSKPASIPAQQFIHAQRVRQEQVARASQLQQHATAGTAIGPQGQLVNSQIPGYPHNPSIINSRFPNGVPHLPEGVSELEKQRQQQQQQQLARQNALSRKVAAGNLSAAQIQSMKQQQMFQQQQMAQAQQAGQHNSQGPQSNQASDVEGRSTNSPAPQQSSSPSKRQRLSPDGAYAQVAPNRFVGGNGQQPGAQSAQQMLLNSGMNPAQINAHMIMKQQQQAAAAAAANAQQAQHLQQPGHPLQQPGGAGAMSQAALQAQQIQQYSNNLMQNHRAVMNMGKVAGQNAGMQQPGAPHVPGGLPMIGHTGSDPAHPGMFVSDMYGQNPNGSQMRMPPGSQPSVGGNTNALQDYQMQLMMLEQQNKRRLMVARQEQQDAVIKQPSAAPGMQNDVGYNAMSPQQGRPAPSPQANMEMGKRATPKIANQPIPGSPLPDGQQFGAGQRPSSRNSSPNMAGGFSSSVDQFNVLVGNGGGNMMMRNVQGNHSAGFSQHLQPMGGNDMTGNRQAMAGRQPNGLVWAQQQSNGQPMMAGQQGGQQPGMGPGNPGGPTSQPQSRQHMQQMPPPQAPSAGRSSASPSMSNAPISAPTPPASKLMAKGKKEREPKKRTKKQTAAAIAANNPVTPSATSEPQTPTTPITPIHPNSFSSGAANQNGTNSLLLKATSFSASQNASAGGQAAGAQAPDVAPSSYLETDAPSLFPEFGAGGDNDITDLEFDISTFLNEDATAGGMPFDAAGAFTWNESVEATGDV
ncbi:hypothetical protein V1512DRAFT_237941 [Lipomyces arxii]|uniref:uncharacterized protein n=1 Tax=Lipomyces arxii TaxID=56418 RepID=UPI0034CD237D